MTPPATIPTTSPSVGVSPCPVNANGVPAEWVECTVATESQTTIVYLVGAADGLESARRSAEDLAIATGARVLTVACSGSSDGSFDKAVMAGLVAWTWLLTEGCAPDRTTFVYDVLDRELAEAVMQGLRSEGLPVPRAVVPAQSMFGGRSVCAQVVRNERSALCVSTKTDPAHDSHNRGDADRLGAAHSLRVLGSG